MRCVLFAKDLQWKIREYSARFYTTATSNYSTVVGLHEHGNEIDPEYKTTAFFQIYFQEKNILYSGQYGNKTKLKF